ncbi:MAG: DarT ssDNA thymidine ADP-ribosyltransferase family protein [Anaerolineae bacterium]
MARKRRIENLYYIAPVENLPSILERGVLSHAEVEKQKIRFVPIYDAQIVASRQQRTTPDGSSLWEFANFYFQARNPMLYRVVHERKSKNIVVLALKPQVLDLARFISIGNAASPYSEILPKEEGLRRLLSREVWEMVKSDWWRPEDGSKRIIMSECLVYGSIPADFIHTIYVADHQTAEEVRRLLGPRARQVAVVQDPPLFFRPRRSDKVTASLSWVDGDMFFSHMQTLTVSVNIVGVMGKGLASRAKYQFPDVYVVYQDVCRKKRLVMGKPYLYKREISLDQALSDEPLSPPGNNESKWFLLFPTKRHWRERSDIHDIEKGLQWIRENYLREGIKSLAVPALGCGLGGLEWREVGPLMCRYLSDLEIQVAIYLPQETKIPQEYLTREFLLGSG